MQFKRVEIFTKKSSSPDGSTFLFPYKISFISGNASGGFAKILHSALWEKKLFCFNNFLFFWHSFEHICWLGLELVGQDASDAGKSGKLLFLPAGASQTEESHAKNARGHQTGLSLFSRARQKICRELA